MCEQKLERSVHLNWWYCAYGGCGPTNKWQVACCWSYRWLVRKKSGGVFGSSAACIASTFSVADTLHPRETQIEMSQKYRRYILELKWLLFFFSVVHVVAQYVHAC
jgi:hypothetical protein